MFQTTIKQKNKTCETRIIFNSTSQRKAPWPQSGRESTLTFSHSCHCTRIPFRKIVIKRLFVLKKTVHICNSGHIPIFDGPIRCLNGCFFCSVSSTPIINNTFKHHVMQKSIATRKIGDSATNEIRCSNYTGWPTSSICTSSTKKGVVCKCSCTVKHSFRSCHRIHIPVGYVLIERRCLIKHCKKREGCNKEKIEPNPPHKNNNDKVPFQTTNKEQNNTCETCDPTNLELSYIYSTTHHNGRRRGHREGHTERGHLLRYIVVTSPVFQLDTS